MKHSDVQEKFETGAKRDTQVGKLRYDLISPLALQRLAVIYTKGAEHYGDRNWEKGMPFTRVMASMQRHLFAFILGDTSEDHLAQCVWNGVALLHFQEAISRKLLEPTLNDMPAYELNALQAACKDLVERQADPIFDVTSHPDSQRNKDFLFLIKLGCPETVARQIIGGTTYSPNRMSNEKDRYVYIAGPMRGYEKFNFPAFDAAREAFLARGYNVISPADIDRFSNKNAEDTTQDVSDQTPFVLRDFWANFFLKKQGNDNNGIVLLDGWQKSTGASGEFFLDRWLGLKAYKPDGFLYPIDTAKHDYALAHAMLSGTLTVTPMTQYDGDWDHKSGVRGRYCFWRIEGTQVFRVFYDDRKNVRLSSCHSFAEAKACIDSGHWTRI